MLKIEDITAHGYERVVVFRDDYGFYCCIAVHSTKLGPALRWLSYLSLPERRRCTDRCPAAEPGYDVQGQPCRAEFRGW
jgi:hypothetical protein